jgi:pimeloyl-ACP methyl ester carboxylesterase
MSAIDQASSPPAAIRETHHELNGHRYWVRDSGGDGEPVLLLHGWPDDGSVWRMQVPALAHAGFRVVCIDWLGHGRSDKPRDWSLYRFTSLAADFNALLDRLGLAKVHAVAHDYGAVFLWEYGMHNPGRLTSMTVLSAGHPMAVLRSFVSPESVLRSWYLFAHGLALMVPLYRLWGGWLYKKVLSGHPDRERMARDLIHTDQPQYIRVWDKSNSPVAYLLAAVTGRLRDLPTIPVPVMGLWSSKDLFMVERQMTGSRGHVGGSWRYERIDGPGHWLQLQAPEHVNTLLLDWLMLHADASSPSVA